MPEKVGSSAQVLAGKRAEPPVMMRNGTAKRSQSRTQHGIAQIGPDIKSEPADVDGCITDQALAQRLEALQGANLVRIKRAQVRRHLGECKLDFEEVLDDVPPCCAKVPLVKLLTWLPGVGSSSARRILHGLPPDKITSATIGDLEPKAKYIVNERAGRYVERYKRGVYGRRAGVAA